MPTHDIRSLTRHLKGLFQKHDEELHERLGKLEREGRSKQHHSYGDRKRGESKKEREVERGYLGESEMEYKKSGRHLEKNERLERAKTREHTYPSSYLGSRDAECSKCLGRGQFTFQCPNWETKLKRENRDNIISISSSLSSIFKSEKKREKAKGRGKARVEKKRHE